MPGRTKEDPRLTRVSALCLALPEAARTDMGDHAAFAVRGRKFAYFLNDHHGDGIVSVCTRAFPGENTRLIEAHPRKFYSPAYIGPRGWVGLRLDRGTVDWNEVRDLLIASYLQVAPKKLSEQVEAALE
jgi:phosphoribosylglycinamide formyltransferase-1